MCLTCFSVNDFFLCVYQSFWWRASFLVVLEMFGEYEYFRV